MNNYQVLSSLESCVVMFNKFRSVGNIYPINLILYHALVIKASAYTQAEALLLQSVCSAFRGGLGGVFPSKQVVPRSLCKARR